MKFINATFTEKEATLFVECNSEIKEFKFEISKWEWQGKTGEMLCPDSFEPCIDEEGKAHW